MNDTSASLHLKQRCSLRFRVDEGASRQRRTSLNTMVFLFTNNNPVPSGHIVMAVGYIFGIELMIQRLYHLNIAFLQMPRIANIGMGESY